MAVTSMSTAAQASAASTTSPPPPLVSPQTIPKLALPTVSKAPTIYTMNVRDRLGIVPESVSDVTYSLDAAGFIQLAPQSSDVHIDRPVAAIVVVTPDAVEQGLSTEDPSLVAYQESEQLVLLESQFHQTVPEHHLALRQVNRQVATFDELLVVRVRFSLQDSSYPRYQLGRIPGRHDA